jgi:hypothetical protein
MACTWSHVTGTPIPASRRTISCARLTRLSRMAAISPASSALRGSNRYASTCTLCPESRHDSSMPGTRVSPGGSAAAAAGCPATVSWSVSAITFSPASAARAITSDGGVVPSETLLWLCRSARSGRPGLCPTS